MDYVPLCSVTRGSTVESVHSFAIAAVRADGELVGAVGSPRRTTFGRSALKPFQSLPLFLSGAADAFGISPEEEAVAMASHFGEGYHVALVSTLLGRCGLEVDALGCGPQVPLFVTAEERFAEAPIRPSRLHHNCSGKHAAMLLTCRRSGFDNRSYLAFDHPLQALIRDLISEVCSVSDDELVVARDGCGAPTYALPLLSIARGYAKLASQVDDDGGGRCCMPGLGRAARALRRHPFVVSGRGATEVRLSELTGGRVFGKVGAEGVLCLAIPELRLGVAIKCADGSSRTVFLAALAVLARLGVIAENTALTSPVTNSVGECVGEIRVEREALSGLPSRSAVGSVGKRAA